MSAGIKVARNAKNEQYLAQLVRTSAFGICTRKQRIDQAIAAQCRFQSILVRDESRERAIERELKAMQGRDGWGVPTGNQSHPVTIKYNALRAELANGPQKVEYRLWVNGANCEYFNELTKTEWEYAQSRLAEYNKDIPQTHDAAGWESSGYPSY